MVIPPVPRPPRRIEFRTHDPAEAREFLDEAFGARLQVGGEWDSRTPFAVTGVSAGPLTSSVVCVPTDLAFRVHGRDLVYVNTVVEGTIARERAGAIDERYRRGDIYLSFSPEADWTCRSHNARVSALAVPATLLADVHRNDPGCPRLPVQLSAAWLTPAGARQWRLTSRVVDDLLAGPDAGGPLVIASAGRLLAATALAIFTPGADDATAADRTDARPDTVRQAVSYIEAHPARDITVADLAEAAHVSVRAVQLAFRRHLDTTPTAYLRRVRLDLAHRQLQAADPQQESVTAVAAQWGFASASRFAQHYRRAYGVRPSDTLNDS